MKLTSQEKDMLKGKEGNARKKSMQILTALGRIYGAKRLIDVASVQIAGVSYKNLGEAGLEYLSNMAKDGTVKVLTTLNPAGMDLENWQKLGIKKDFAIKQEKVIEVFKKMGITVTCTCTPYLIGNLPRYSENIAWSESSAVCFANSVLGAKTNREGGPSSLASALTGKTPEYGMHLEKNRQAKIKVKVKTKLVGTWDFGALGKATGQKIGNTIPLFTEIKTATTDELKSLCASIATYGGTALFHIQGITPNKTKIPTKTITITKKDLNKAKKELTDNAKIDFVGIGCPHASIKEITKIAKMLKGKKVKKEMWISTARPTKSIADKMGYSKIIEKAGAKFACDTCFAVAPLKGRFKAMATDSAKGCYYAKNTNKFATHIMPLEECVRVALK